MAQVTEQSASASEELASSSEEFASQAEDMRRLMSFFIVNNESAKREPTPKRAKRAEAAAPGVPIGTKHKQPKTKRDDRLRNAHLRLHPDEEEPNPDDFKKFT